MFNKKTDITYNSFEDMVSNNEPLSPKELEKVRKTLYADGEYVYFPHMLSKGKIYGLAMAGMSGFKGGREGAIVVIHSNNFSLSRAVSSQEIINIRDGIINGNIEVSDLAGVSFDSCKGLFKKTSITCVKDEWKN